MDSVLDYIELNRERYTGELEEFLRIPSISNDPDKRQSMVEAAEFAAGQFRDAGLAEARLFETGGPPIVFGASEIDTNKPTVLIYAHYDVQPVDPLVGYGIHRRSNPKSEMADCMPVDLPMIKVK